MYLLTENVKISILSKINISASDSIGKTAMQKRVGSGKRY